MVHFLGLYPPQRLREPTVVTRGVMFFPGQTGQTQSRLDVSRRESDPKMPSKKVVFVTKKGCRKVGELNDHLLFVVG